MEKRRQFLKTGLGFLTGLGVMLSPLFRAARVVYANARKIIVPRDADRSRLKHRDPAELDTRNLEPTPLEEFQTMGDTDYRTDLNSWRLAVTGRVRTPLSLTYDQIVDLPAVERNVLLICPGFFVNHGRWKGISMAALLERAQTEAGVTHVSFAAAADGGGNEEKFPIADILADRVYLAYGVNGRVLPQAHGFPLRVVAEGYLGSLWVKYVTRVSLV